MPKVTYVVEQHNETVSRYIVNSIAIGLLNKFGLSDQFRISISEKNGQPFIEADKQPLETDSRLEISYKDEYDEKGLLHGAALYRNIYPKVFEDKKLGISIEPIYAKSLVTMEVTAVFKTRSEANYVQRRLRTMGGLPNLEDYHGLTYNYNIPTSIMSFIYDAWYMRENVEGYDEDFETWLDACLIRGGYLKRSNLSNSVDILAIIENQNTQVALADNEMFYRELEESEGTWRFSFTYTFSYDQVTGAELIYPLFVHNQRIPDIYAQAWQPNAVELKPSTPAFSYLNSKKINYFKDLYVPFKGGNRFDAMDDWFPSNPLPYTGSILIAPLVVDYDDRYVLVNLYELKDYVSDFVVETLMADRQAAVVPYEGPYFLEAFRVNEREETLTVTLEANGDVRSLTPLDLRRRHFIRISGLLDLSLLRTQSMRKLIQSVDNTVNVLSELMPSIDKNQPEKYLTVVNDKVTELSFNRFVQKIPQTNKYFKRIEERPVGINAYINVIMRRAD